MPVITCTNAYLVDLPVEAMRADAVPSLPTHEAIYVQIGASDGRIWRDDTVFPGGVLMIAELRTQAPVVPGLGIDRDPDAIDSPRVA